MQVRLHNLFDIQGSSAIFLSKSQHFVDASELTSWSLPRRIGSNGRTRQVRERLPRDTQSKQSTGGEAIQIVYASLQHTLSPLFPLSPYMSPLNCMEIETEPQGRAGPWTSLTEPIYPAPLISRTCDRSPRQAECTCKGQAKLLNGRKPGIKIMAQIIPLTMQSFCTCFLCNYVSRSS